MRALKTLLIILLAVVVLAVLLGLLGPKHSHLERKTVIAAPAAMVWDHVKSLKAENEWSPFLAMEPSAKVTFEGTDGEVGSKSSWAGEKIGKGEQVVNAVDPGKHIGVDLHFIKPFEGLAKGAIDLVPKGDSTEVTWSFDSENGFLSRIIYVFKDMDAMMGPVFASGLESLKKLCEADVAKQAAALKARTFRGYTIQTVDRPAVTYLGKRKTVNWNQLEEFFGATFGQAAQAAGKAGLELAGSPSGVFFEWDTIAKRADLFAGIPVQVKEGVTVPGLEMTTIPAGKALLIAYRGNYGGTVVAHYAMEDMIKANGLEKRDAVIEEYVTDPTTEPDTAKWLTNILYPIK
ncbi:MAG: SRPBCC family protein [Bacteroidetes bacterium]|nr:SRPBCC family protein [Bacteroidota bacterium]MBS1942035.1 SRPBCC family protein [Bacteroidota bacterium]